MQSIDYYFSLLSPFTYLAGTELERIAEKHGAAVRYKPIDILELFAETGTLPPARRHWSRQVYRLQELNRISRARGLPINEKPAHWPTDASNAAMAVIAAREAGQPVGEFVHALLRGVWREDRDISDLETVAQIARDAGVDPNAATDASDRAGRTYRENTAEAVKRGVFGSPFYFVGDERFWGQDRLASLDDHLSSLSAMTRRRDR
ncbi:MAG: 2-hydroxychromene-2-carboxylate isomerase [Proteobacteria bacterium]|nr:MAG: 2-hydroxychromene-2-carboxylate isomerase [Pseudomonadota bacterium]